MSVSLKLLVSVNDSVVFELDLAGPLQIGRQDKDIGDPEP